jgi:hypothetical protein
VCGKVFHAVEVFKEAEAGEGKIGFHGQFKSTFCDLDALGSAVCLADAMNAASISASRSSVSRPPKGLLKSVARFLHWTSFRE